MCAALCGPALAWLPLTRPSFVHTPGSPQQASCYNVRSICPSCHSYPRCVLRTHVSLLPPLLPLHTRCSQAATSLEGARRRLEGYVDSLDMQQAQYEEAEARLRALRALLKECECGSVRELLTVAADARGVLEQWGRLAGAQCTLSLC